MDRDWKPLGSIEPKVLIDCRLQLHYAAQVVSGAARAMATPREDHSHTALSWSETGGGLFTEPLPGDLRVGLIFADRRLIVSGLKGDADFHLKGHTLAEAYAWLSGALSLRAGRSIEVGPADDYEMPEHPVGAGEAFTLDPDAARTLGVLFGNADAALQPYAAREHASPIRCWPHHFDIAALLTLDPGADAESARSVGLGLTPGDGGIPFPYFYVTPWPAPENKPTPDLPAGEWNTEGWFGAVLTGQKFIAGEPEEQGARVAAFLEAAHAACLGMLQSGTTPP